MLSRLFFYGKFKKESILCYNHYMEVQNLFTKRKCTLSNEKESVSWYFVDNLEDKIKVYCQDILNRDKGHRLAL